MHRLSRLRQWINRDDGRHAQIGNRKPGALETTGWFLALCALVLWQLHSTTGLDGIWSIVTGVGGLVLASFGMHRTRQDTTPGN